MAHTTGGGLSKGARGERRCKLRSPHQHTQQRRKEMKRGLTCLRDYCRIYRGGGGSNSHMRHVSWGKGICEKSSGDEGSCRNVQKKDNGRSDSVFGQGKPIGLGGNSWIMILIGNTAGGLAVLRVKPPYPPLKLGKGPLKIECSIRRYHKP